MARTPPGSRPAPGEVRPARDDARARAVPGSEHVGLPAPADRGDCEHLRAGRDQGARGGGAERLDSVVVQGPDGDRQEVPTAALFVLMGAEPRTDWLAGTVELDEQGYVLTGRDLGRGAVETSLPGVFAAGDVRRGRSSASPGRWARGRSPSVRAPVPAGPVRLTASARRRVVSVFEWGS
ncbi:FAD-dependent oxidoreductase [Georgenia muralis]|uniref:FAD-dependent oxidoreductase n=1 Tax=Georgenia muralis TaxID=154117 RepID=UPI003CCC6CFD